MNDIIERTDARSRRGPTLRGLLKRFHAHSLVELRGMMKKLGDAERTEITVALDRLDEGGAR